MSNCVCNLRVFTDDARGCQCPFVLCFHPQVCLRKGVRASHSYQEQTGKSGSFGLWLHPRGYVSNFLMRPASSIGAPERLGTPSRRSRGIDTPVAITRGEGAQMKWFREPWCSPRVNPACRGTFAVASRVSSTVSHLGTEHGTSLETPGISVFPWSETGMLGNYGVASRVPSSISNFKMERGTSLETLAGKGLILR